MGTAIGFDITIAIGGGQVPSIGDFILCEDGNRISTESYETLIQE